MASGWVKIHRELEDHWIWESTDPMILKFWILLLLSAGYEKKKVALQGRILTLERGSFLTSIRKLANKLQISTKTVEIYLKILEEDGMIIRDSKKGFGTKIAIVNYGKYQE